MAAPTAGKKRGYTPGMSENTSGLDGLPKDIVITSPFGAGKTHLAGTWSADWPKSGEGPPEGCVLSDIAWICADKGALNTHLARRIRPKYVIDMAHMLTPLGPGEDPDSRPVANDYLEAMQWASQELKYIASKGVRKVVVDTVTTLQSGVVAHWFDPERVDPNKFAVWDKIQVTMYRFWQVMTLNGFRVVWLAHPTTNHAEVASRDANSRAPASQQAATQAAAVVGSTPGDNLIVPGIQGKSRNLIIGNACLELWLDATDNPGKGIVRHIMPYGGDGAQGKNRYHNILARKEPADLAAMEAKILKHIGNIGG